MTPEPKIFGISENAIIGEKCIIFFVNNVKCLNEKCLFVVVLYDEPFEYLETEYDYTEFEYNNHPWYNDYKITYNCAKDLSKFLIQITNVNEKIIDEIIDTEFDFQFGDSSVNDLHLSNGDILVQNFGNFYSTILFTKNNPKFFLYSVNERIYNNEMSSNICNFCKNKECNNYLCFVENYYKHFFCEKKEQCISADNFYSKIQNMVKQEYLVELNTINKFFI